MNAILLVDDNPQVREGLAQILTFAGYHVRTSEDGLAALRALEAFRPDAIVCDVEMPRLDGFSLLRQLRERTEGSPIPFIFLTGLADPDSRQLARDLGADDYLVKPVTGLELIHAIGRSLAVPAKASAACHLAGLAACACL